MFIAKFCRYFICVFTFGLAFLSAEHELLHPKDINQIMKQIFEQHVDKKVMTSSILKHSFRIYIDQFDPNRIYLLAQEVKPFLELSDQEMGRIMEQYQHNQFPEYKNLNDAIQKTIFRVRQIRSVLERDNMAQLFQASAAISVDGLEEWRDPDLKLIFAKNESELTERIKRDITQFISSERKRYGNDFIDNRKAQTLKIYEKQAREHENQYLFLNTDGKPMNEDEQQNAFTMHVLKALANSLDAHTAVLDPVEADDMRIRLEKEIPGVGVKIQTINGAFVITQVIEGGPAARSGLIKANDQIIEIDGMKVEHQPLSKVLELVRGKKGSKVTLLVSRKDEGDSSEKTIKADLVREEIAVNEDRAQSSFETFGQGIIGKINLNSFYQSDNGVTSENDVREAIKKLDKEGNLRGLILDLRENSGGFLSQAVKVAGLFITNGVVVISKYFNGEEHFYRDMDGKMSYSGPLIILTSKATASAAEIVAQALQDYGVAVIVGDDHTYGKGTIQSQTVTENQASTYFKVTVGKYYTVSGKTPQMQGVKSDIIVPSQFLHENLGEEYLDFPLKPDTITPQYNDSLEDVSPTLKAWYMRYYVPTLQHKKMFWRNMIPTLKKNSEFRISRNKNYQMFLKGVNAPENEEGSANTPQNFGEDDLQMEEAINIMKDMIVMQSQKHGTEDDVEVPSQAGVEGALSPKE